MIGRIFTGSLIGIVLGLAVAALLVKGLGIVVVWPVIAYVLAAVVGALTGLFAGKPIWAAGGKIEGGLKAVFGAVLAAIAMFVLRTWVKVDVDLSRFGAGAGALGEVPAAALPVIAGVLGALFGLDNTPDGNANANVARAAGGSNASAAAKKGVRVEKGARGGKGATDGVEEDDEPAASRRARR